MLNGCLAWTGRVAGWAGRSAVKKEDIIVRGSKDDTEALKEHA